MSEAPASRLRWLVVSVFVLSTAINYLDRQTLATLAPLVRAEFHLSNAEYGWILTAFSICYALTAPGAGLLIDRFGLSRATSAAVAVWSLAGMCTGLTRGLGGLAGCRAVLGASEAAGIPSAGKAIHAYLRPAERALGNAVNQAGVSLGLMLAPPAATWIALHYGWRQAFLLTGVLGLMWIPLWRWASHLAPAIEAVPAAAGAGRALLKDRRLWRFMLANALSMVGYSLWTNWTTLFLVEAHKLSMARAAWYAAIPPLFATLGGLLGGWASLRLVQRGGGAARSRIAVCGLAAALSLVTAAVPLASGPGSATALISLSIFAVSAFSVNMYTLPLDVFGGDHAAFAVSLLVASYGAVQAIISPAFGRAIDLVGYGPVAIAAALAAPSAFAVLWTARPRG